ncbi:MAG: transglutaminase domain-containing protein [Candidatus Thorarchaeota archaeon]
MRYCVKCKLKYDEESKFCEKCGKRLLDEEKAKKIINKKKTIVTSSYFWKFFFIVIILALIISSYFSFQNYLWAKSLQNRIPELENKITELEKEIGTKQATITQKEQEISSLRKELQKVKDELQSMTRKYEEAKPYQERVSQGQNLQESYNLLSDYEDYAKDIILDYLGLSSPTIPSNDNQLWERGRKIYDWLSANYDYCGDKGLRVGTSFYEFQFYSPDELLMSDNERCGDCDDFATLFAGLMYASGVPKNKVWVVCGKVPEGGHCWNWLSLDSSTYRVDPVCSQKQTILNILGLDLGIKGAYYTSTIKNVDCFSEYEPSIKMNPMGYYPISSS